jgi:hypothetical protein
MCLVAITDESEVRVITRLKQHIVEEPAHLNLGWLSEEKWIVVPRESAGHFDDSFADSLSEAFTKMGCSLVFAITTEAVGEPICYSVTNCKKGLVAVSLKLAPFNFTLMPADRSAGMLCTVHDYSLIAGPMEFVRNAVGGDIKGAWDSFEQEASDPWWEGRLQKVADRYRTFSGSVPQPIP